MESERYISIALRKPNERWIRLRRTERMKGIGGISSTDLANDKPPPKNPFPLLEKDQKIIYENQNIKAFPQRGR